MADIHLTQYLHVKHTVQCSFFQALIAWNQCVSSSSRHCESKTRMYWRSAIVVDSVDLSTDEHSDLTVLPLLLVGDEIGDQKSQTWHKHNVKRSFPCTCRIMPTQNRRHDDVMRNKRAVSPPSSKSHHTSTVPLPCFFWNCWLASNSCWSATFRGTVGLLLSGSAHKHSHKPRRRTHKPMMLKYYQWALKQTERILQWKRACKRSIRGQITHRKCHQSPKTRYCTTKRQEGQRSWGRSSET